MAKALIIGVAGAMLFELIGLPLPWMLGPLFAVLSVQLFTTVQLKWHPFFRNAGLAMAGYLIGYAFTLEALQGMLQYLPVMVLINVGFFILFLLISALMARRAGVDKGTALTCCVPGGLQQLVVFAEEEKNMDLSVVTFYHVIRVLMIVTIVPFVVTSNQTQLVEETVEAHYSFYLAGLLVLCYAVGFLCSKIKMPTSYMLGPVLLVMCFNLAQVDVPVMPESLLHIAQLGIGIYIGLLLKKEDIHLTKKHVFYSFFSSAVLILSAIGISLLLSRYSNLSFSTSFLSVVPGGLDQVGIIAASIKADVTIVTAFQLFRILFISILVIPFVKHTAGRNKRLKPLRDSS